MHLNQVWSISPCYEMLAKHCQWFRRCLRCTCSEQLTVENSEWSDSGKPASSPTLRGLLSEVGSFTCAHDGRRHVSQDSMKR